MGKKREYEGELDLDFDDEFFPMGNGFGADTSGGLDEPVTFRSYTKNLKDSAGKAVRAVGDMFLPNAGQLLDQIGFAKDEAVGTVRAKSEEFTKMAKVAIENAGGGGSFKDTVKSLSKETSTDIRYLLKNGKFRGSDNAGFDFDGSEGFDIPDMSSGTKASSGRSSDEDESKTASAILKASLESSETTTKANLILTRAQLKHSTKLYIAGESKDSSRHIQSIGYIANIDSNVGKIAKFMSTIQTQSIGAQMEFSEKALALQEDTVTLLNVIKDQTFRKRNDDEEVATSGKLSKLFGNGLDGQAYGDEVMKNISSITKKII